MKIQRLSPEHWQRLRRIRLAALRDAPEAFCASLETAEARDEAGWREQVDTLPTWIACSDGRDVGMVRGAPGRATGEAYLLSMWVHPEYRGRRIGERLVRAVVDWAVKEGFDRLILDVADTNHGAIALYDRMGFTPTGRIGTLPPPRNHIGEHERARRLIAE